MSKRRSGRSGNMHSKYGGCVLALMIALLITLSAMSIAGCAESSTERINMLDEQIEYYQERSDGFDGGIAAAKSLAAAASTALGDAREAGDSDLIDRAQEAAASISARLDGLETGKTQVDALIEGVNQKIDSILAGGEEITLADELEIYIVPVREGSKYLPPPWNMVVDGVLVGALALLRNRKKKSDGRADDNETALTHVVAGVEDAISAAGAKPLGVAKLKETLGGSQTEKTEAAVKRTKQKIKDDLVRYKVGS